MTPTTDLATLAALASDLGTGMKRALLAMSDDWQFPGKATFNANGAHCLTYMRKPPLALQGQQPTSLHPRARWRTAYRLTPLGLALRQHLMENRP